MLRIAFALLIVANLGYYLWNHGHLEGIGLMPVAQTEPQRLEQQIKPEALKILSTQATSSVQSGAAAAGTKAEAASASLQAPAEATPAAPAPAPEPVIAAAPEPTPIPAPTPPPVQAAAPAPVVKEPTSCVQAGGLDERQAESLRRALASKPREQWELNSTHKDGRWMVYMGKFPDSDFLDRKRSELRAMNVDYDRAGGNLEPGLSLGRFSSEEAASRQLTTLSNKGVRTARVVQERAEITTYSLRLPKATASFKAEVESLTAKALDGKALRACTR